MSTATGPVETVILVNGMTCDHCIRAVTDELMALEGVTSVVIDLHSGSSSRVTVSSAAALLDADIAGAIDEAGYDIAGIDRL